MKYPVMIAPTHILELLGLQHTDRGIQVGASVSLTRLDQELKAAVQKCPGNVQCSFCLKQKSSHHTNYRTITLFNTNYIHFKFNLYLKLWCRIVYYWRNAQASSGLQNGDVFLSVYPAVNILVKVSGLSKISEMKRGTNLKLSLNFTSNKFC